MQKKTIVISLVALGALLLLMPKKTYSKIVSAITGDYGGLISRMAGKYDLPVSRVAAIIMQESSGNKSATGLAGERGLMQMMPAALADVNRIYGFSFSFDDLYTPEVAIECGCAYLAWLEAQLGSIDLATQAYNAGIGNVRKNPSAGIAYLTQVQKKESYFALL